MRFLFLLSFVFIIIVELAAQSNKPMRIEVDSRKFDNVYGLSLENEKFVIIKNDEKKSSRGEDWKLDIYGSTLKKINTKDLFVPRNFVPLKYRLSGDSILWLAFAEPSGKAASFLLFRYNFDTGLLWSKYVKGSRKSVFLNFEVTGDKVIIIGERINDIVEEFEDSEMPYGIQIVSPLMSKYSEVITSKSFNHNSKAIVIVDVYKGDNVGLYYYEYSNGNIAPIKKILNIKTNVNIIDGSLVESTDGSLLFMGTYNYENKRNSNVNKVIANGTFIGKLVNGEFSFFKTNDFSEYRNIFATLTATQQKQIKQKVSKGKDVSLAFKMLTHDKAIKQGDLYVVAAETYFAEFHYENNFDSRGYMYQNQVFDGYRTTNCILSAYNESGDMVWDNYMHSTEILELSLQENIMVFAEGDSNIVMAYYYNGDIYNKTVNGNEIVFKKSKDRVETTYNETVISEKYGRLEHWYGKYFMLTGFQNVFGVDGKKKKVFFFNLISFE